MRITVERWMPRGRCRAHRKARDYCARCHIWANRGHVVVLNRPWHCGNCAATGVAR